MPYDLATIFLNYLDIGFLACAFCQKLHNELLGDFIKLIRMGLEISKS